VETNGIHIGVDSAIPCGLIVNELVTNSLKYAFPSPGDPAAADGEVSITLDRPAEDVIRLNVGDNGIGLPAHLDPRAARSLGLQLVQILSEQLGGTLAVEGKSGARFTITFPS
jgi:two-component sensor histidine kinase